MSANNPQAEHQEPTPRSIHDGGLRNTALEALRDTAPTALGDIALGDTALGDTALGDTALEALREATTELRQRGGERTCPRIPLEQVERELARVMHIELALLLVRARDLMRMRAAGFGSDTLVLELQKEARESIDTARACGVRVPRPVLRLVAGEGSTWPCVARLERWARTLDPDVDLVPGSLGTPRR